MRNSYFSFSRSIETSPRGRVAEPFSEKMGRRRGAPATDAAADRPRAPPPTPAVMTELASSTHFTASELAILSQRFGDLDSDGDGLVDADEVCAMGEVAMYPLLRRVVSRYNEDKSGALTFSEFSRALSTLSAKASTATSTPAPPRLRLHTRTSTLPPPPRPPPPHAHIPPALSAKATLDEKLQFAFALYDVNGNGRISADEMFDVFRLMSPRNYTDDALQQIVSAFMAEYPQAPPHLPTHPPTCILVYVLPACPPSDFMAGSPQGLEFEDFSHES